MFNMTKTRLVAAVFTAATAGFTGSDCVAQPAPAQAPVPAQAPAPVQPTSAQAPAPVYRIKPSDVAVPPDVPLGQYRRSFRPFENWTLICDENLKMHQMVCNVAQSVTDAAGATAFSWSLAAAAGGQPFFILRTMPDADPAAGITLRIGKAATPIQVPFEGCNQSLCLGKLAIGPQLRAEIEQGAEVIVSYRTRSGQVRGMRLPLKGLDEAVASIGSSAVAASENPNASKQPANKQPANKPANKPGASKAPAKPNAPARSGQP